MTSRLYGIKLSEVRQSDVGNAENDVEPGLMFLTGSRWSENSLVLLVGHRRRWRISAQPEIQFQTLLEVSRGLSLFTTDRFSWRLVAEAAMSGWPAGGGPGPPAAA